MPLQAQCHDLVEQYGPALLKLLAEDIDPDEICSRLGLCPHRDLVDAHPTALLDQQASLPDEIQVRMPFFQFPIHSSILKPTTTSPGRQVAGRHVRPLRVRRVGGVRCAQRHLGQAHGQEPPGVRLLQTPQPHRECLRQNGQRVL